MLTLAKKLSCFKEPVLLLLFGVEEVVSDAPEEGLSIGYMFKNINDSFWVSGCGGLLLTSHKACKHLEGSPRRFAKAQVHQGDQAKVPTLNFTDQVLLLAVGISAGERDIVEVFPEEKNKY